MILRSGLPIPIVAGRPPSGSANDFVGCPPIVCVHVVSPEKPEHDGTVYEAMVDTGADVTVISVELAKKVNATLTRNGVARGFSGMLSGVRRANVSIRFPTAGVSFEAPNAGVLDLATVGTFDVILGRAFLRHCRLTVDGPNGEYRLEWLG